MFAEKNYYLDNIRLASTETRNKQTAEMTVVFIHGWLDNSASFHSVMAALQPKLPQAHFVAVDLPGHGHSDHKSADNFYPFHDYIDDLNQLLSKLSPNKLILVGHSLGALIASCYSAAFPEEVDGLVQIEGYGPLSEPSDNTVSRLRNGVISRQRLKKKAMRHFESVEEMIEIRAQLNRVAESEIAPVMERGAVQQGTHWLRRHDPKLKSDSLYRMSHEHALAVLKAIQCPHEVIMGETGYPELRDLIEKHQVSEEILHEIPGGHHCHLQYPELTSEIILGLVNKI